MEKKEIRKNASVLLKIISVTSIASFPPCSVGQRNYMPSQIQEQGKKTGTIGIWKASE